MRLVTVAGFAVATCVAASVHTQEPWRTSFDAFVRAIAAFPINEIPYVTPEAGAVRELQGLRVSGDRSVMKRYGGRVEFEGTFKAVTRDWNSALAKPREYERIDIEMAWPAIEGPNPTNWTIRIYPKARSLKNWKALKPDTAIRFGAVVTGIALHHTWIPGVDLRWYSILLEDAELVAK